MPKRPPKTPLEYIQRLRAERDKIKKYARLWRLRKNREARALELRAMDKPK